MKGKGAGAAGAFAVEAVEGNLYLFVVSFFVCMYYDCTLYMFDFVHTFIACLLIHAG